MAILNNFKFFDETSTQAQSNVCVNTNATELILEVGGSVATSIIVEGSVDAKRDNWSTLAIIDTSNFSVLESIKKNGVYAISIVGISKIRLSNGASSSIGKTSVFGKLVA